MSCQPLEVTPPVSVGRGELADPPQLAQHVLATESGWDRERIEAVIAAGRRSVVRLSRPLSVYVLYGTALADEDGSVRFMRDIYGHDARMARLLGMTDPTGKPSI